MQTEKKFCPDCGCIMVLDFDEESYYCIDPNCSYEEDVEQEEDDEYRCPHCRRVIEEEDLP